MRGVILPPAWRTALPPLLTLALAAGYVGIDAAGSFGEPVLSPVPPLAHAALVVAQAAALVARARAPRTVLVSVAVLDAAILATSGGQLGIGAFAVLVAAYDAWRRTPPRAALGVLVPAAAGTALTATVSTLVAGVPPLAAAVAALARVVVAYALPVAAAEFVRTRAQLAAARADRERLRERERAEQTARVVRAERTALARELHDVAGHHLSGIIVTAQAAAALSTTDPARTRELLRSVEADARTALVDLRRTVGLLRADDEPATGAPAAPARATLDGVRDLAADARAHGRDVRVSMPRRLPPLGLLAHAAAYRMVQESLANAARHAPGAPVTIDVDVDADHLRIVVHNPPAPRARPDAPHPARGYGLAGMRERADLVGARVSAGATAEGGWRNELVIPVRAEEET